MLGMIGLLSVVSGVVVTSSVGRRYVQQWRTRPVRSSNKPIDVLIIAGWFGLVTGLLEGLGLLVFQNLGWLGWNAVEHGVSAEIVWISAFFDFFLFGILGLALSTAYHFFPWIQMTRFAIWFFASLSLLNWLALAFIRRIYFVAILVLAVGLAIQFTRWFIKDDAEALQFWRRSLPWLAMSTLLVLVGIQSGLWLQERIAIAKLPATSPDAPNVLVIVVDTLRADHLSSYGYALLTSPNIDHIAKQGVLFENAFSTSSYTLPSHASLLTGLFPSKHGAEWNNLGAFFKLPHLTLGEAFLSRGYRTAAFSANLFYFTRAFGFSRGFIHFEDYFHSFRDMLLRTLYGRLVMKKILHRLGYENIAARKLASDVNRAFLQWIKNDRERPFFVFLNYMDTHDPYLPPHPFRSKFSKFKNPGGRLNCHTGRCAPSMSLEQLQREIEAYDGAIAYVDDQIGQLLAELEKRRLNENTIIVITSDHGESFGEHDLFLHSHSLYREVIHVPLIIWGPGKIPAGVRVSQPVTNAALPVTLIDLLGASKQELFPRRSLTQLWEGRHVHAEWPFPFAEMTQQPFALKKYPVHYGPIKTLVSSQWHYIVNDKRGAELYAWKIDFGELHNLVERPELQGVVARFHSQLLQDFPDEQRQ
jgi:arylsulfatase A-like enzyme